MYNTESISYAFREDPATIIALEDGGVHFKNVYQITAFRRKLIRPDLIETPLFFCDNESKYIGQATDIMNQIFDDSMSIKYDYAVVVDSQIEFEIDYSILNKLSKEYMPARDADTYQQYFNNYTSGVIVFCRVYKIDKAVSQLYLQKGKQGSAQVIKLYDEFDLETSITVKDFTPVISENKFCYIKDEIIHFLKAEGVFISLYQNTIEDNKKLDARLEADKTLKNIHNSRLDFDENLDTDMAKLDYDLIFDEVVSICPGMKVVIDNIRNIQAARYGEANYLLNQRDDIGHGVYAKQRLFDMNLRMVVKNALYYYNKYGIDIEDAFQEASIGLLIAIDKYNENVQGLFPSYVSTWIYQVMSRNLPIYQHNVHMPVHYVNKVISLADKIVKTTGESIDCLNYDELLKWIKSCSDVSEKEAKCICSILAYADNIETLVEHNENVFSDGNELIDYLDEHLSQKNVNYALECLNERERNVIEMRYGYRDKTEMTLNDVGKVFGLTRERIRQIESKAIMKISRRIRNL